MVAAAAASEGGITPARMASMLSGLSDFEVSMPRPSDRVRWTGAGELVVFGTPLGPAEVVRAGVMQGFSTAGAAVSARVFDAPPYPALTIRPARIDFGPDPEARRAAAPKAARGTISTREMEFSPQAIEPCTPETCSPPPEPEYTPSGIEMGFAWSHCGGLMLGDDQDADGLRDYCEQELAIAFRPFMRMQDLDHCPQREPYWSATYYNGIGIPSVMIYYLVGYHRDCGSSHAHKGDSEFVIVYVSPPSGTSDTRWRLNYLVTSAHYGSYWTDGTATSAWDQVQYPAGYRGAPRVWVALDKHANYRSQSACNSGAYGYDTCSGVVVEARMEALSHAAGNIGNKWAKAGAVPLKYTLYSRSGQPGVEAPWGGLYPDGSSRSGFCGWQPYVIIGECAGGYYITLEDYRL